MILMKDEEFDKAMDTWASKELESAPQLHPTGEMYRMVKSRRRKAMFPIYARWVLVGVSVAALVLMVILNPLIFRPSDSAYKSSLAKSSVGLREGFPPGKGEGITTDPKMHRGGGPKKGRIFFKQLIFQYQKSAPRSEKAIDIRLPREETLALTSDDNYRLLLQPVGDLYVYIYQMDSCGVMVKLFPNNAHNAVGNPLIQDQEYYLPSPPNWFYLDDLKGEERIYIIASARQMQELEDLYEQYDQATSASMREEILSRLLKMIEAVGDEPAEDAGKWVFVFSHI